MVKNLGNKIGNAILLGIGAALGYFAVGPKYNLENSTARQYYFPVVINKYVQDKENHKIKYVGDILNDKLKRVIIDGERFNSKDTLVYPVAEEEWHSLKKEISNIHRAKHDARVQKRLDRERAKTEKALEVLRE